MKTHERTKELDALMREHQLTARAVGDMLGRDAHTVRCWRSKHPGRVIPEHALELLKLKLAERSAQGGK